MPNTREKLIDVFCSIFGEQPDYQDAEVTQFVDELIAHGVTVQRWIPATERLPEENERVLVYHDDGVIRFGINKGGFADVVSSLYLKHNHRTCFSKVTHWMPLPEPPKGEEP